MNFNSCLGSCTPSQIININTALNDLSTIEVFNQCGDAYSKEDIEYSYSTDGICWSCYGKFDDILANVIELDSDYYVRIKVTGQISKVIIDNQEISDYSVQLSNGFEFKACDGSNINSNIYNPYINMDCAISLNQQLTEMTACVFGIPCYYFNMNGANGARDITFKEYLLTSVVSVKQIKIIIADGQMPSSKPEFSDFGLDWQDDWETDIAKGMFATAFGSNAQPTEGDLVYIPMMKRMWMVSKAYEEKKDALMWNATTFKVALTKYQKDGSVDLGDAQDFVDTIVKNKYDDLFGDEETIDSGIDSASITPATPDNLYPIYKSDATRKFISTEKMSINDNISLYYKGTVVSDSYYQFNDTDAYVSYQQKFCGDKATISFIITHNTYANNLEMQEYESTIFEIGHIKLMCKLLEKEHKFHIELNIDKKIAVDLDFGNTYFVVLRWSREMKNVDFFVAKYTFPENIPLYKLQPHHYWFDIDNPICNIISKYNIEFSLPEKSELILHGFDGNLTNIKLFDYYNDNLSEILMQYPNNKHLLINDTCRKIMGLYGVTQH